MLIALTAIELTFSILANVVQITLALCPHIYQDHIWRHLLLMS